MGIFSELLWMAASPFLGGFINSTAEIAIVLEHLNGTEREGGQLRMAMKDRGYNRSLPSFYSFMADLEAKGHVIGFYRTKNVGGEWVRVRCYQLPK